MSPFTRELQAMFDESQEKGLEYVVVHVEELCGLCLASKKFRVWQRSFSHPVFVNLKVDRLANVKVEHPLRFGYRKAETNA